MPQLLELPAPTPDRYDNEAELTASLQRKGTPEPGTGLYPRDGSQEVTDIEDALSELTIPGQRYNVVVSSGMAAVSGAVRASMRTRGRELGEAPVLAHPDLMYAQSIRSFEGMRYEGMSTTRLDPGDRGSIDRMFDEKKADVIFVETVSNTPDMPVADVHYMLDRARAAGEDAPILVFDNTLPLSTGMNFEELLEPEDRVLVVESATKSAMHNSEHLGVVYSKNEELIDTFRRFKVTEGIVTSTGADAAILRALKATTPGFHERNRALYESTAELAGALAAAQSELGPGSDFTVSHPTLSSHPNYEYAESHLVDGASPVVFMSCTNLEEGCSRSLLKRIAEHPRMREQIAEGQAYMGQSFGFKEATLLYDPNASQVRVAGGYDIDSGALAEALYEAAADV
jgi:cystathionine beta-lyase/cystathionine gamma-synthase